MTADTRRLSLIAPGGIPEIGPADDLADVMLEALSRQQEAPQEGDIFVLAQKIVSKWEGRVIRLSDVVPSVEAVALGAETEKDPRIVELILQESSEIVRKRPGLIIARHRCGWVLANAGIDMSNTYAEDCAILLPKAPDLSADILRNRIRERTGRHVAIVINDSMGRPWRMGTVGAAIGSSGVAALQDRRGFADRRGRPLQTSVIAAADEIAAAASLLMGQGAEGLPLVVLRGAHWLTGNGDAQALVRPLDQDLFR